MLHFVKYYTDIYNARIIYNTNFINGGNDMRKRIAVFMGELCREIQTEFSVSIREEAKARNYDIFLFANFGAYTSTSLYDDGERDIVKLPDFSTFDGVISLADTYDIVGMEDNLLEQIRSTCDIPVVSIRNGREDTYRIKFNDYETSYQMTRHFTDVHKFTRICYMSGPQQVEDAIERLQGFTDAMKDAGVEIAPNAIFEGDFWTFLGEVAAHHFVRVFGDKLPEAIICANDYMALSVCNELKAMGIRIPEDITICGCDDTIEGSGFRPSLTTVHMPIKQMAAKAIDIVEAVNRGETVEQDTLIPGDLVLRGSCGCSKKDEYYDPSGLVNQLREDFVSIRQASLISIDVLNCLTEEEKLNMIDSYFYRTKLRRGYVCLCTEQSVGEDDEIIPYTDNMILRKVFPVFDDINNSPIINKEFNRSTLLPEELLDTEEPNFFMVFPIHHKNLTFGYLVCEDGGEYITPFISGIIMGLASSYEDLRILSQFEELAEIKRQNLHDPLTGLMNRRGFDQQVSNFMNNNKEKPHPFTFVSVDMDYLKKINDTYGHLEGDEALKALANVLTTVVGDTGIAARVGGDEFLILLTSDNLDDHEHFIARANIAMAMKNKNLNKPYDLHASFGAHFNYCNKSSSPISCIKIADKKMYEEKIKYKADKD